MSVPPLSCYLPALHVACIFILAHSSVGSIFTQVFTALGLFLTQLKELLLQIIVLGRSGSNLTPGLDMKLGIWQKLLCKSGHHIPLLSVLCYGRFRSSEQRGIGYKRRVVEIQRTMQSCREVSHLRYVENYPSMSSMRGRLQPDNSH